MCVWDPQNKAGLVTCSPVRAELLDSLGVAVGMPRPDGRRYATSRVRADAGRERAGLAECLDAAADRERPS
jgi:hypothetical protein